MLKLLMLLDFTYLFFLFVLAPGKIPSKTDHPFSGGISSTSPLPQLDTEYSTLQLSKVTVLMMGRRMKSQNKGCRSPSNPYFHGTGGVFTYMNGWFWWEISTRLQICPRKTFSETIRHRWYQAGSRYWWNYQGLAAWFLRAKSGDLFGIVIRDPNSTVGKVTSN